MERLAILGVGRGSAELYDLIVGRPHPATPAEGAKSGPGGPRAIVFLDDKHPQITSFEGREVLGPIDHARRLAREGHKVVSGIANVRSPGLRTRIAERLELPDEAWLVFAPRDCTVSHHAVLEPGVVLYPGVRVATGAVIGRHSIVYYNSVIHHDVVLGAGAVLCAGVNIAGNVTIGEGAYLGVGSTVKDHVRIGERAVVGAGAVVIRDVPAGATVAGVPAAPLEREA